DREAAMVGHIVGFEAENFSRVRPNVVPVVVEESIFVQETVTETSFFLRLESGQPSRLGLYDPLTEARYVAVMGRYAYVATGFQGLRVACGA
ncbi:MAG: hypothetical protein KKB13_14580, partial [Chloroflexi bacterium]|nr:hypothetical protein [Chloroflexota bacterium]